MTDTELVTIDSNKVWAYTTSAVSSYVIRHPWISSTISTQRILHLWKLKEASAQEIVQAEGQLMKDLYRTVCLLFSAFQSKLICTTIALVRRTQRIARSSLRQTERIGCRNVICRSSRRAKPRVS